jgi:hypothetical protein
MKTRTPKTRTKSTKPRTTTPSRTLPPALVGVVPVNDPCFKDLAAADEQARILIAKGCGLVSVHLDSSVTKNLDELIDQAVQALIGHREITGNLGALFDERTDGPEPFDAVNAHVSKVEYAAYRLGVAVGCRIGGAR